LRPGWTAVHGGLAAPAAPAPALHLDDGGIRVYPGEPPPGETGERGPVYELDGGAVAVPTGRVFVRFAEGIDLRSRAAEVERAGFAIESVPTFAPHAAWLRPVRPGVARALLGLERLACVQGVERLEPQMLSPRRYR
jgi:hypothetical protein